MLCVADLITQPNIMPSGTDFGPISIVITAARGEHAYNCIHLAFNEGNKQYLATTWPLAVSAGVGNLVNERILSLCV